MIFRHLSLSLALLLICPSLFADTTNDTDKKVIETLQAEITKLSDQQEMLKQQKDKIQQELHKTITQLETTRQQQVTLNTNINQLNISTKELAQNNSELEKKIVYTESEKKRLEDDLASTQEDLTTVQMREKELTRSKLTSETKSALELHRLQRNLITLQEKIENSSWSDAVDKHMFKLLTCFVAGGLTSYGVFHYLLPEMI